MKQANENYKNWRRSQDVNYLLLEWLAKHEWHVAPIERDDDLDYIFREAHLKDFAVFFAERVKGAPLESKLKK